MCAHCGQQRAQVPGQRWETSVTVTGDVYTLLMGGGILMRYLRDVRRGRPNPYLLSIQRYLYYLYIIYNLRLIQCLRGQLNTGSTAEPVKSS